MANNDEWLITADLACLKLNPDEAKYLAEQAAKMNDLFALLAEAEVDNLEPTTHALVSGNVLREDVSRNFENCNALVDRAPESEDGFFLIPNLL